MSGNRGVVYLGSGKVEVQKIDYPKMQDPRGRKIEHGVILRVVSTNICGSDQHMVRGRTTAQVGLVLVNINPAYRTSEVEYALNKVGCKALVTLSLIHI